MPWSVDNFQAKSKFSNSIFTFYSPPHSPQSPLPSETTRSWTITKVGWVLLSKSHLCITYYGGHSWKTSRYLVEGHSYTFSVFPFQNVHKGKWYWEKSKTVKDTYSFNNYLFILRAEAQWNRWWDTVQWMYVIYGRPSILCLDPQFRFLGRILGSQRACSRGKQIVTIIVLLPLWSSVFFLVKWG